MFSDERSAQNPKAIARIDVDRLFGNRNYVIPPPDTAPTSIANLLILYGDNGSGKTTVLRMLYSLLSPSRGGGFKSFIARTPFASFAVTFADGTKVTARRSDDKLVGSYDLSLAYPDGRESEIAVRADRTNKVRLDGPFEEKYSAFLAHVRELGVALYYLSDDRRLQVLHDPETDVHEDDEIVRLLPDGRVIREHVVRGIHHHRVSEGSQARGLSLEPTIDAFNSWTRQHALRASNVGEGNTNLIYTDLIRRITYAYGPEVPTTPEGLDPLKKRLVRLANESTSFVTMGLISRPPVDELMDALAPVDQRSQAIVGSVLEPYIDGLEARLKALRELHDVLSKFVQNLNELYAGKRVTFSLRGGLRVHTDDGSDLPFEFLSSGEKQLLVLLCNTIIARDRTSIFVIDEPELSLNVKWQRKLVRTLLDGVSGSAVQFILATHSIELLSAYRRNVAKLETTDWHKAGQSAL